VAGANWRSWGIQRLTQDVITLRHATVTDAPTLESWDAQRHVISATTDDSDAAEANEDLDWTKELASGSDVPRYWIAELEGRPIGAMQMIDPFREPTKYWGDVAPNCRALDIWIGSEDDLSKGYGDSMMRQALAICFADPTVTTVLIDPLVSNIRAQKFYRRLGFQPVEKRTFDDGSFCLVHRLTRARWQGHNQA
jgi:aminoglycoside 6'-N-acetyltransferase